MGSELYEMLVRENRKLGVFTFNHLFYIFIFLSYFLTSPVLSEPFQLFECIAAILTKYETKNEICNFPHPLVTIYQ